MNLWRCITTYHPRGRANAFKGLVFLLRAQGCPWHLGGELLVENTFWATTIRATRCSLSTISYELKEGLFVCCQLLTISCFICNVKRRATSRMALNSPLSSFHLASLFPIFCHHAITSNFKRVCYLKKVLYMANLAFAMATFRILRFHFIAWPCSWSIIVPLSKFVCAYKLATVSLYLLHYNPQWWWI